jgi:hypothetical protein
MLQIECTRGYDLETPWISLKAVKGSERFEGQLEEAVQRFFSESKATRAVVDVGDRERIAKSL